MYTLYILYGYIISINENIARLESSFGGKWESYRTTSSDVNKYDVGELVLFTLFVFVFV